SQFFRFLPFLRLIPDNEFDSRVFPAITVPRIVRGTNRLGQNLEWRRSGNQLPQLLNELGRLSSVRQKHYPRLGAELPRPQGERGMQSSGKVFGSLTQSAGQNEHWIRAAHLR